MYVYSILILTYYVFYPLITFLFQNVYFNMCGIAFSILDILQHLWPIISVSRYAPSIFNRLINSIFTTQNRVRAICLTWSRYLEPYEFSKILCKICIQPFKTQNLFVTCNYLIYILACTFIPLQCFFYYYLFGFTERAALRIITFYK